MPVRIRWNGVLTLTLVVLLVACLAPTALAEVRWSSGAVSTPEQMRPARLAQTIAQLAARPDESRVVLHFEGPVQPAARAALEANGIRLLNYLGGYAYFAALEAEIDASRIVSITGPIAVESIDPSNKLHPDLAAGIARPWSIVPDPDDAVDDADPSVAVYVLFHRDFDLLRATELIQSYDGKLQSRIEALNGVVVHLPMSRVAELAGHDDVMYVEPPLPALQELNDSNRIRVGIPTVSAPPYNLDGTGVTVMVYDGGQVALHEDLAGRLTIGASDNDGISDHATHVACTVGGDDFNGNFSGMAPAVDIVSYSFEPEFGFVAGFLYTDPGDIEADYTEAKALYDADLSNNSIGTNVAPNGFPCEWEGNYGTTGALIDEIVRGTVTGSPFRIVWANGNERGNGSCGTTYHTTPPPACAKNSMTIGALNSNDDSVTSFTSWGPCDDGRLKPDVSAPGCQSSGDGSVTSCSSNGGYTGKCGTSMASPTAAGVSALVLQQYRESFPSRPDFRNSLLRAIMAQTAVDLGNAGPDFQTGYGSIRAQPAVDLIIEGRLAEGEVSQGEVYAFTLDANSGEEIKITLAWDDPAGTPDVNPVLVNDVDLRIVGPDSTVYHPWTLDPDNGSLPAVRTQKDGTNNIEQVKIDNASVGTYTVEVTGFNIADGPEQSFGLAMSHAPLFCTLEPTFAGLVSVATGSSCGEIDLAWNAAASNCIPEGTIRYNVYRSESIFVSPLSSPPIFATTETSVTDFGLEPGKNYFYIVRAEDSASGEDSNIERLASTAALEPDTGAPVFAGLSSALTGPNCGEILLDWPAAVESCSGPVTYDIYRSVSPGPDVLVGTTHATSFVDTSGTSGTTHGYLVRARDTAGNTDTNDVRLDVTSLEYDVEIVHTEFDVNNSGWAVVDPNDAAAGNWEWGNPQGTEYQPEDDNSEDGLRCWITGLAAVPSNGDVDAGTTTLLSALYDMTGAVDPTVSYARWFTNDRLGAAGDPTDNFLIDVSNDDGQSWASLEVVGAGTPLAWVPVSMQLPIPATGEMRFRFQTADLLGTSLVEAAIDSFSVIDEGQGCYQCTTPPSQTLCSISVNRAGDDVVVDWSTNPVGTRAVVYHVPSCEAGDKVKLGTSEGTSFVHDTAALTEEAFNYRVTFVDECGNEQAFCGATDCP